jgi:hypothetical protein
VPFSSTQYAACAYCLHGGLIDSRFHCLLFLQTIWADFEDCTASVPILLCRLYGLHKYYTVLYPLIFALLILGIFGDIDRIKNLEREVQLKFLQKDRQANPLPNHCPDWQFELIYMSTPCQPGFSALFRARQFRQIQMCQHLLHFPRSVFSHLLAFS